MEPPDQEWLARKFVLGHKLFNEFGCGLLLKRLAGAVEDLIGDRPVRNGAR
jgi:hypothetical protein